MKFLHWPEINLSRLLWIEGSPSPHKAKGRCEMNWHWPIDKIVPKKRKIARLACAQPISRQSRNYGKEACGFPNGRLVEQTRERCPHILALANTRTALRAWWEDIGDITRLLLAAVADPLARQGARMSDTITLCTRILLIAQDLHSRRIDHGGSGGVRSTWGGRWKRNIAELLSCSR